MIYHFMDRKIEKRDVRVNAFKAASSWYDAVRQVANRRHTKIGGAIIYLVELGLPVEHRMSEVQASMVVDVVKEIEARYHSTSSQARSKKGA